jgi:tRNA pseudouridine(55) synthase
VRPGFLVMDKPAGITSHDVVAVVRAVTGVKKVGHTGTLDPFATGVLPLALGPATRLIQYLDESIKGYDATISFGQETDTGDPTGEVIATAPVPTATRAEVESVLTTFLGERMQTPPQYSAVKHKGKRLYQYARKGERVEVAARPITIHGLEIYSYDGQQLHVNISCSRGTYARVLANEIAVALGSVGHLSQLSRSRSGPFYAEDALSMPELSSLVCGDEEKPWKEVLMGKGPRKERVKWRHRDEVRDNLREWMRTPLNAFTHLSFSEVGRDEARRVRNGGSAPATPAGVALGGRFLVVCGDELVAISENTSRGSKVLRVFPKA